MAQNGRELTIAVTGTTITGVRTRSLESIADAIDVTNDDSSGNHTVLAIPGKVTRRINFAGITEDETLLGFAMAAPSGFTLRNATVTLPSDLAVPGTIAANMFMESFNIEGSHDGAWEFSGAGVLSGTVTYTASATS
jgi:predicted secreted protein